jgi:hypothetical protein
MGQLEPLELSVSDLTGSRQRPRRCHGPEHMAPAKAAMMLRRTSGRCSARKYCQSTPKMSAPTQRMPAVPPSSMLSLRTPSDLLNIFSFPNESWSSTGWVLIISLPSTLRDGMMAHEITPIEGRGEVVRSFAPLPPVEGGGMGSPHRSCYSINCAWPPVLR